MAQLKDTEINGNLNVSEDVQIGDVSVLDSLTQIDTKADASHTHDDRYYTESEIDSKLSEKANTSHGNHVPTIQTASNKVFLRNDNTWQTVTPANIGAAASSHSHSNYLPTANVANNLTTTASGYALDARQGKALNDKMPSTASNGVLTIGNYKIIIDSWVTYGIGQNYVKMGDASYYASLFGVSSFNVARFYCNIMNADAGGNAAHATDVQWWNGDGLYAYFSASIPSGLAVRINFIYIYRTS